MTRLYFITYSMNQAKTMLNNLHYSGLQDWRVSLIARDTEELSKNSIRAANILQERDIIHSGEQGGIIGSIAGLVVGFITSLPGVLPFPFDLSQIFLTSILFCLFGAWLGGITGMTRRNYRVNQFEAALNKGACLIMVDIDRFQKKRLNYLLNNQLPDIKLMGTGSSVTNPFTNSAYIHPV